MSAVDNGDAWLAFLDNLLRFVDANLGKCLPSGDIQHLSEAGRRGEEGRGMGDEGGRMREDEGGREGEREAAGTTKVGSDQTEGRRKGERTAYSYHAFTSVAADLISKG